MRYGTTMYFRLAVFTAAVLSISLCVGCGGGHAKDDTPFIIGKRVEVVGINDDTLLLTVDDARLVTERSQTIAELRSEVMFGSTLEASAINADTNYSLPLVVGVACVDDSNGVYLVFLRRETLRAWRKEGTSERPSGDKTGRKRGPVQ